MVKGCVSFSCRSFIVFCLLITKWNRAGLQPVQVVRGRHVSCEHVKCRMSLLSKHATVSSYVALPLAHGLLAPYCEQYFYTISVAIDDSWSRAPAASLAAASKAASVAVASRGLSTSVLTYCSAAATAASTTSWLNSGGFTSKT
jgi:hypothetical protein